MRAQIEVDRLISFQILEFDTEITLRSKKKDVSYVYSKSILLLLSALKRVKIPEVVVYLYRAASYCICYGRLYRYQKGQCQ